MVQWMGVINLTPDSFYGPSRADSSNVSDIRERIRVFIAAGASIIDLGAVSTRPGAAPVPVEDEWMRLAPVLRAIAVSPSSFGLDSATLSIDTTSAEIVRRVYDTVGPFIVNDISAGIDDSSMLKTVGELGLTYVAMHKKGTPQTMDDLTDYPGGVMLELVGYFKVFARMAGDYGIENWILDPGLGFAKTEKQNWEILRKLKKFTLFRRPILVGAAEKRFTKNVPHGIQRWLGSDAARDAIEQCGVGEDPSGTDIANVLAVANGASILRVHYIANRIERG